MRKAAVFVSASLFFCAANVAEASPITQNFTVVATSGVLAGDIELGSFSFDSSSVTPGATNYGINLLTALNFTWDGIAYTTANATSLKLSFDGAGDLIGFVIGSNCTPASCVVNAGQEQWWIYWHGDPGNMAYSTLGTPIGSGLVFVGPVILPPPPPPPFVPEPWTLSLLGMGLAGVFAARRRKSAKFNTRLPAA